MANTANEAIKTKVTLQTRAPREHTQMLMEGDIIVPDVKPDMAYILKTDADIVVDKTEIGASRLEISGRLNIRVLYLAKTGEKSIHSINISAPFDEVVNVEGLTRDMWAEAVADVSGIDYKMLNDRKINYRAVIDIEVSAESAEEREVVGGIEGLPETQVKKRTLLVGRSAGNRADHFTVRDEAPIPSGKPNIREILQTNVSVTNKDVKVSAGWVNISGELVISSLYSGSDEENILEFIEHELPFNGSVDFPQAGEGMLADVVLRPQGYSVAVKADEDGEDRVIETEVTMSATVKLSEQVEVEVLDDAYIVGRQIRMSHENINYPRLVCANKNQCTVKEIVELDEECPEMLQIFRTNGKISIDEIVIGDDRVVVDGVINTDILYIAKSDDTPIYNYKTAIPFRQTIETRGCRQGMRAELQSGIEHTGFNMLSARETEIRYLLSFNVNVTEDCRTEIVSGVDIEELDKAFLDDMASLTVYIVQPGDSLWKIAKKYNTPLEELSALNDVEDGGKIYPGQKLLILKKTA